MHHVIAVQHCSPRFCHGMLSANRVHSTVEPRTTYVLAPTLSSSRMHSGTRGLNPIPPQSTCSLNQTFITYSKAEREMIKFTMRQKSANLARNLRLWPASPNMLC